MGILEIVKEILSSLNLFTIKNEINLHGDINIPLKCDTVHYTVPKEAQIKISKAEVTPEMEKTLEQHVIKYVKSRQPYLEKLTEKQRSLDIAGTSVATAVRVLSGETTFSVPPSKAYPEHDSFVNGETDSATTIYTPPRTKNTDRSDDEGETM